MNNQIPISQALRGVFLSFSIQQSRFQNPFKFAQNGYYLEY